MVCRDQQCTEFQFTAARGRLRVEVPWWSANALRNRLRDRGIRATACFDPVARRAALEMDGNVDLDCVRAVLAGAGEARAAR